MKKSLAAVLAMLAGLVASAALSLAPSAYATETGPSFSTCPNLAGWYVNPDEDDRKPEATVDGLKFEASDLIHHPVTGLKLADLKPGSYSASPDPDQPSFFSVEIRDAGTGAYGTLRRDGDKWTLVTNTDAYAKSDPAEYIGVETKWGKITEDTKVVSFGVGYTKNPPGSVTTVVTSVTFDGKTYSLTCVPPSSSASPSASASASASVRPSTSASVRPSASAITSAAPVAGAPSLPVTGPSMGVLIGLGLMAVAAGLGVVLVLRRRKLNFRA